MDTMFRKFSTWNNQEVASIALRLMVFCALAQLLILLPEYDLFFGLNNKWFDDAIIVSEVQPSFLRMMTAYSSGLVNCIFVTGQIVCLGLALVWNRIFTFRVLAIWFTFNTYNYLWPVQDGGNNLTLLLLVFSLLMFPRTWEGDRLLKMCGLPENDRLDLARWSEGAFIALGRIQIFLVYLSAALSKVNGTKWKNGTVMYYVSQSDYYGVEWFARFLAEFPIFSALGAWSAIAFQFLFVAFIWDRRYKLLLIGAGILFHFSIAATMNLHIFSFTMCCVYAFFLTTQDIAKLRNYILPRTQLYVAFDSACAICQRFSRIVRSMSPTALIVHDGAQNPSCRELRVLPIESRLAMIASFDGDIRLGFATISGCLRRTYLGPVLAPLCWALEKSGLGERMYRAISSSSYLQRCHGDTCAIGRSAD